MIRLVAREPVVVGMIRRGAAGRKKQKNRREKNCFGIRNAHTFISSRTLMTKLKQVLIFLFVAAAGPAFAEGLIIGFTNVQGVAGYSQTRMDEIAQFKWYFAHASVGANMMDGISDLNTQSNTFFRIRSLSDDATPPTVTTNARIYEYARDNPGWSNKVVYFENYVSNGWRNPSVNIAFSKFCWIDQEADVDYYITSMANLEGTHPETLFIYATMPLDTSSGSDNNLRNIFNETLRGWVWTNNRVLFDIADIEAHDTNGVEHTFTYSDRTNQMLYGGYTTDGGHLNDAGNVGRQQVAKGFYALASGLLDIDRDNDGMSDGEELIAGMCPTSSASVFKFECPSNDLSNGTVISWPSTSNRFYVLQRITNLIVSASTSLLTNSVATPPMNCYTDAPAGSGPFFYKVGVRQ
jgi:hypothetical protein